MRSHLRVGTIPYLVSRPLDCGLEQAERIEVVRDVPARLIERLRAGTVDVALVSSIELFRGEGYAFIAGPAVAGRGYVASVQLFLRRDVGALRSVVLDPSSRAAQALTRVVLSTREPEVEFVDVPIGSDPRAAADELDAGGWLRIGDRALIETLEPGAPRTFNPSEAWARDTGLPFVFAVWIVRPGVELSPAEVQAFVDARARGAAAIEDFARDAATAWSLPLEACRKYLMQECLYDPGELALPALLAFRERAAKLGLCRADLTPRAIRIGGPTCRA